MIKFENTQVVGFEPALRGMRNPLNSWKRSDSEYRYECTKNMKDNEICEPKKYNCSPELYYHIGENDSKLAKKLIKAGSEHRKFLRMINVYVDIIAPLYWWKEFDTYKIGTVSNSCSTMHKIHEKEFTIDDFSHEHLFRNWNNETVMRFQEGDIEILSPIRTLNETIKTLNLCRRLYNETKDKKYWWQMIQLLPSSYNQKRTIMTNYEVLSNIYVQRKAHKLDEWEIGCIEWIKSLPYFEMITGEGDWFE